MRVQVVSKPTVISTFAGCGGSSLGYQLAGFHELLAVEWDDNAVATFRLNFPEVPVYHGDIAKLSGEECMRLAGIKAGELDVLDGSPPCQGFSTAGNRRFSDPRNSLFKEYARLLSELQPRVFVMENVTGMIKGHMKQAYLQIIKTLRECGYKAKGEVLNAMYFNVPQHRERVIVIGVRNDLGIEPSHPKPQTRPVCVAAALKGVDKSCHHPLTKLYLRYWKEAKPGGAMGKSLADWKLHPNKPCRTIRKKVWHCAHWAEPRWLSARELAVLASFSTSFRWIDETSAAQRIGNSVPPNLMHAIAEHIKANILQVN